jgi:tetratricopeptide (TPR) repeat protein
VTRFLRHIVMPLALLALVSACTTPQSDALRHDRGHLPVRADVTDVPFYPQDAYYCGPASLAAVLTWSGVPATQKSLAPSVFTPGKTGTLRTDMITAARRNGRLAVRVKDLSDLLAELAAGRPVIVFQNLALAWYPLWHFAVAVGYDLDAGDIILNSGTRAQHRLALDTFERTWARGDRWALLVLRPGELPVNADAETLIDATIGLERAGRPADAATSYAAILRRFPLSGEAALGYGNALFAAGDFAEAAAAYHRATIHSPGNPIPWNNLAMALTRIDRRADAVSAAKRAIDLAGDAAEPYRKTLREITGRQL